MSLVAAALLSELAVTPAPEALMWVPRLAWLGKNGATLAKTSLSFGSEEVLRRPR